MNQNEHFGTYVMLSEHLSRPTYVTQNVQFTTNMIHSEHAQQH